MSNIEHLVISSTLDYGTDYICYEMMSRGLCYLRLNRDQFSDYDICYDLSADTLHIDSDGRHYEVDPGTLRSIYFRAPVFVRTNAPRSIESQLYRSQWSSFLRNLMVFDGPKWVNHPRETFVAESKALQLRVARRVGLTIPETWVTNCIPALRSDGPFVAKALDTALFYEEEQELFTYSSVVTDDELNKADLRMAPVILQTYLADKIDLRVTVVGTRVFAVQILRDGYGIEGDWRKTPKEELVYRPISLPGDLENKLLLLMQSLGLVYGGIDLIYSGGQYYFIEVNPTGEWCWLAESSDLPIQKAIVDCLEEQDVE